MQHPFSLLEPEYNALLARMTLTRRDAVYAVANRLVKNKSRYVEVSQKTGIPIIWIATSFEREASSDFSKSPAQGDPWNRVSTHVPKGRGPFPSWTAAALDAYHIDGTDKVRDWTWARAAYEWELFNGFGPRNHGKTSGYLWAGSNIYTGGKYVSDGVWNPAVIDQQLGCIPIAKAMVSIDSTLDIPSSAIPPAVVTEPLTRPPVGVHDALRLQQALNRLGASPKLDEDGSYGRKTRAAVRTFQLKYGLEADGLAGPKTWAALDVALQIHAA